MKLFSNKLLTGVIFVCLILRDRAADTNKWCGGHYDNARAVSLGALTVSSSQSTDGCGCYQGSTAHIETLSGVPPYNDLDGVFVLLYHGFFDESTDTFAPETCEIFFHNKDQ